MHRLWVALVVLGLCVVVSPRTARADASTAHTVAVTVLALDSDDAEEQADGMTAALKSRIRSSQGWSLTDTTQSLGMLTAALRCPGKPILADCEQRISEHLKSDRFIFGYVTKGPQKGEVTAEVHLYQKSKPDTVIRESYAENLKDPNDDALRARAQKILERLGGTAVGTIVVKMGNENGEVIVDGDKHVPLTNGSARVDLAPGTHSVEVATKAGTGTQKRNISVTAGKETVVDLALATTVVEPSGPPSENKPFPVMKAVGGGLIALGVASAVVSVIMGLKYSDAQSEGDKIAPTLVKPRALLDGKNADESCGQPGGPDNRDRICTLNSDAKTYSAVTWVTASVGAVAIGAGVYLLFFHGNSAEKTASSKSNKPIKDVRATPVFGLGTGGFALTGSF